MRQSLPAHQHHTKKNSLSPSHPGLGPVASLFPHPPYHPSVRHASITPPLLPQVGPRPLLALCGRAQPPAFPATRRTHPPPCRRPLPRPHLSPPRRRRRPGALSISSSCPALLVLYPVSFPLYRTPFPRLWPLMPLYPILFFRLDFSSALPAALLVCAALLPPPCLPFRLLHPGGLRRRRTPPSFFSFSSSSGGSARPLPLPVLAFPSLPAFANLPLAPFSCPSAFFPSLSPPPGGRPARAWYQPLRPFLSGLPMDRLTLPSVPAPPPVGWLLLRVSHCSSSPLGGSLPALPPPRILPFHGLACACASFLHLLPPYRRLRPPSCLPSAVPRHLLCPFLGPCMLPGFMLPVPLLIAARPLPQPSLSPPRTAASTRSALSFPRPCHALLCLFRSFPFSPPSPPFGPFALSSLSSACFSSSAACALLGACPALFSPLPFQFRL